MNPSLTHWYAISPLSPAHSPTTVNCSRVQLRDLASIGRKIKMVCLPCLEGTLQGNYSELRDWDLWGPLLLCLALSLYACLPHLRAHTCEFPPFQPHSILTWNSNALGVKPGVLFAAVFAIVALGSMVVTINTKLLGGRISFFQTLCALGYCTFPVVLVGLLLMTPIHKVVYVKLPLCAVAWFWASWGMFLRLHCVHDPHRNTTFFPHTASLGFVAERVPEARRTLATYPIVLFYFYLSWLIAVSL